MTLKYIHTNAIALAFAGLIVGTGMAYADLPKCDDLPKACTKDQSGTQRKCQNDKGREVCDTCVKGLNGDTYHWRRNNNGNCYDTAPVGDPIDDLFNNY